MYKWCAKIISPHLKMKQTKIPLFCSWFYFLFYFLKKKLIHSKHQILLRYCYSPQGPAEFHPSQPGSVSLSPSTSQIWRLLLQLCRPNVGAHSSSHPWPVTSRASPHRHSHHLTAPSPAVHQAHVLFKVAIASALILANFM
jgi:hypothetical protein